MSVKNNFVQAARNIVEARVERARLGFRAGSQVKTKQLQSEGTPETALLRYAVLIHDAQGWRHINEYMETPAAALAVARRYYATADRIIINKLNRFGEPETVFDATKKKEGVWVRTHTKNCD